MKRKIERIGFDLDGVIIDKPPIVPKWLIETVYRGSSSKKELSYRYPTHTAEIKLRQLSHHPLMRPPIKKQIKIIRKFYKSKKYKMYAVTSRYSFLKKRTEQWFDYYKMNGFFEKIYINEKDQQPHIFKEQAIKKLKLDIFIDDDKPLLEYLEKKIDKVKFIYVEDSYNGFNKLLDK